MTLLADTPPVRVGLRVKPADLGTGWPRPHPGRAQDLCTTSRDTAAQDQWGGGGRGLLREREGRPWGEERRKNIPF